MQAGDHRRGAEVQPAIDGETRRVSCARAMARSTPDGLLAAYGLDDFSLGEAKRSPGQLPANAPDSLEHQLLPAFPVFCTERGGDPLLIGVLRRSAFRRSWPERTGLPGGGGMIIFLRSSAERTGPWRRFFGRLSGSPEIAIVDSCISRLICLATNRK